MTANERKMSVIATVKQLSKRLFEKYPVLKYRTLIGVSLLLISISVLVLSFFAIHQAQLYFMMIASIFALSVLHELEHDLIHKMYFRKQSILRNIMLGLVWLAKPAVNPWWRSKAHLNHHLRSGQTDDVEERFIGNGAKRLLTRLLLNVDLVAPIANLPRIKKLNPSFKIMPFMTMNLPAVILNLSFPAAIVLSFFFDAATAPWWYHALWAYVLAVTIPNNIRQFCLAVISSNIHYVHPKHITEEVQMVTRFPFSIMNFFAFNFGRTHVIHHFFPHQTFYERQMTYAAFSPEFIKEHFIVNDMEAMHQGNTLSANRAFTETSEGKAPSSAVNA